MRGPPGAFLPARWPSLALLLVVLVTGLSGCTFDASTATVRADIQATGSFVRDMQVDDVDCPDQAELRIDVARLEGRLTIDVLDGDGAVAFTDTYDTDDAEYRNGEGVGSSERSLFGAPGGWTLRAEYEVTELGFEATLECSQVA